MLHERDQTLHNPIRHFPGYILRVVSHKLMTELSQGLARLDLRVSEATVLMFISDNPGIRQSEIGSKINIARANMAPLIGKMEKRGIVSKQAIDGRSYGLFLTEDGKRITAEVISIVAEHEKNIEQNIPEEIYGSFMAALNSLNNSDSDIL